MHRCKGIVVGVLDFSRPKPAVRSAIDVNVVLEKTLFLLKHHSRFKKLRVVVEPQRHVPLVHASEEQLVQVVMALLLNAMDAMHERGTITLRTRHDAPRGSVLVEVIDQGAQALIELATVIAHQIEVLRVAVPAAVGQRHHANARFDQPPR